MIWIIIIQTNSLNDFFYNDYKRYELEKEASYEIARDIENCKNYEEKTIVYISDGKNKNSFLDFIDSKEFTIQWGTGAFNELGVETTKFINNLGYKFEAKLNINLRKEFFEKYINLIEERKNDRILEVDNYIIVNIDNYLK